MKIADERVRFLGRMAELVPLMRAEADEVDAGGGFPERSLAALREAGALVAALPETLGGLDLGAASEGLPAAEFMRALGSGSIAVGRLLEGHVNALRLVAHYGSRAQLAAAARDAADGHLFGIWVTELSPLLLVADGTGWVLRGEKNFCSGAGRVTRPLVTVSTDAGATVMVLVRLDGTEVAGRARPMSGVRGARTADMDLSGVGVAAGDLVGGAGDYLRQPEFSAGAWRGSAVALGGLDGLVEVAIGQLMGRGRHRNPHQAARIGGMMIAAETARAWVGRASASGGLDDGRRAAMVNLARIAVETACLDAMREVERGLGLQAFARDNPVERMIRDLSTYLRQPAPDETLTEAAIFFAERGMTRELAA